MAIADEELDYPGLVILRRLRGLAVARHAKGDSRLHLTPNPEPQEFHGLPEDTGAEAAGLVLEPREGAPFQIRPLRPRKKRCGIGAFCDGTRATYSVGFEDVYPLLYTENAAAVRRRDPALGYHLSFYGLRRGHATLLAPFGLLQPAVRLPYERLGLCPTRYADLCWAGDSEESGLTPIEMRRLSSLDWQVRAQRRARRLMEISEQVATLAAARMLRAQSPDGSLWLLKDGSLFQFDRGYLRQREPLRQVVACVKTHPVPFFGVAGERALARMRIGERSVAFLPRPPRERTSRQGSQEETLATSSRPMACWYLRVHESEPQQPNLLSGVVRLDIAAVDSWQDWVDPVSWAVLDEFHGLSARPDPRYDVMPYGIHECEQVLHSERLPGKLLLATIGG